jgi:hypothetical protein
MTNVVQLDDRRLPHSQRAQRLKIMKRPVPLDLDAIQQHLRRCHEDSILRAEILAIMKAQVMR